MDKKLKIEVTQEKIRQIMKNNKIKVPNSKKPLFEWIVPKLTTSGNLNWSEWINEVKEQKEGLTDLIESGNSFFLWKKTQTKYTDDIDTKIIPKEKAINDYLFELMIQSYRPILCDVEESEKNQKLVKSEEDARRKIEDSIVCYSVEKDGDPKGLAIISSNKTMEYQFSKPNDAMSTLGLSLGKHKCKGFVFLDVIFTKNEKGMRYGSRLLQRIENDYPDYILCLFSVPKRGTMYFYHSKGFSYSDMNPKSPNLLPIVLDKLDTISEAWNEGFPLMTLLHAETELRRPKIALVSNSIDWKIREDVNIFFDKDALNFLAPSYPNMVEEASKYILKNRTCQRIVLLTPFFKMKKNEYFDVCKNLLECGNAILREDSSIIDVTIVCDNNEDRQFLLRKAAANVWGESLEEDVVDPFLQLPTPEKGHIDNRPRTPPSRKVLDSPPPLRYKFTD